MEISCWMHIGPDVRQPDVQALTAALRVCGVAVKAAPTDRPIELGLCLVGEITNELRDFLRSVSASGEVRIIVAMIARDRGGDVAWDLLRSGASDVLSFGALEDVARQIAFRFQRWVLIESLLDQAVATNCIVGNSQVWRHTLRGLAEIARFSDTPVLILGESGTGKELGANLIHQWDSRSDKRAMVILDCSTIVADLSGSEFFGHERGAFTGALSERQGAFALANGGTLFLDEIGELPLPLQAQLLRVIQERTYKRVGGSAWHRSSFRLICATNRDLSKMVKLGTFRADLFYRIAGFVAKLPPLRERMDDIIPLAEHFARQMSTGRIIPRLDEAVRDYLLRREYPGNVRELQQVVARFMYRCADDGTITIGYLPREECLADEDPSPDWRDGQFELLIRRAVLFGAGLKEIGRAAEDCAIRCATQAEEGSLQRAARRLGVTDRALQIRRANPRN